VPCDTVVGVQFQAIGPTQREAILRALHEDVDKLVAEYGGPHSAESRELIEALRQCDEFYRQLTAQLDEQGPLTVRQLLSVLLLCCCACVCSLWSSSLVLQIYFENFYTVFQKNYTLLIFAVTLLTMTLF